MGHGEIRKAMRGLEDQQSENHKHCLGQIALTNTAIELHRRARQKEITGLCDRVHKLEYRQKSFVTELKAAYSNRHDAEAALRERIVKLEGKNAEIRKGQVANRDAVADLRFQFNALKRPLENRVGLQDQVDLLQEHINELAVGEIDPLGQRVTDLSGRLDYLAEAQKDHIDLQVQVTWLQDQVKKLDKHIDRLCVRVFDLENNPARPIIEDVADTAVRLLKQHRATLQTIVEETLSQRTAFESLHRIRRTAREELNEL